ncbi:MAG: hemolysin family protein [Candidatus Sericytochromatia bacterium]
MEALNLTTTLLNLSIVLFLIAANGFFVAAEFALVSVRLTRIEQLAEEGNRAARIVLRAKHDPNRFLSAAQIGITLASLALGWVAEPTVAAVLMAGFHAAHIGLSEAVLHTIATVITFIMITFLHIVLGESIPKGFALNRTEPTVLLTAFPMEWMAIFTTPFIRVLNASSVWLMNRMGIEATSAHHMVYTEDELKRIVTASHEVGILEAEEQAMLHKVFAFSDRVAREVMVPRPDIKMVPADATWEQLMALVEAHGYTRYPVYEHDADHILGFLHLKDLFAHMARARSPEAFALRDILREILFVPETKPIVDLLNDFKTGRHRMAIVMDEYGGTVGLVTPQNLVEEIVGQVGDEFSEPHREVEQVAPGRYRITGSLRIDEFNQRFDAELPTDEYDTMAGWVFGTLGREAHLDDSIEIESCSFTVDQLQGHRITSILFERFDEDEPAGSQAPGAQDHRPL